MSRWSRRRAQAEPLAAIAAVFVVGLGLTAYAGVLDATFVPTKRNVAEPTLDRVHDVLAEGGVVHPERLVDARDAGPDGYRVNLTVAAGGETWRTGPTSPRRADAATRFVSVRLGPGIARPGRLRVEVWT